MLISVYTLQFRQAGNNLHRNLQNQAHSYKSPVVRLSALYPSLEHNPRIRSDEQRLYHSIPCFQENGQVFTTVQQAITHSPSHSIYKKSRSGSFFSTEVGRIMQADIPETIFTLAFLQCLTHGKEIIYIILTMQLV